MCPAGFLQNPERLFHRKRFLINTLAGQGIKHIDHRHDSGTERDLLAGKMIRIATAVPFLVVVQCHFLCHFQVGVTFNIGQRFLNDLPAGKGMSLNDFKFIFCQSARFIQHHVRNLDLSDVVQRCRLAHAFLHLRCQYFCILRHFRQIFHQNTQIFAGSLDMLTSEIIPGFHHIGKADDDLVLDLLKPPIRVPQRFLLHKHSHTAVQCQHELMHSLHHVIK